MSYKLGSLFDGSGGFPLAGALCGIEPVWAAEVEPYPIAVTRSRFPNMKHLGDISKVNGAEIEPVDIITFGSPCQDLSVAGKRAGLKHADNGDDETTRSGLFMEAVRIIKEMRTATNEQYPRFAIWENVPGAFSSNNGEDFRIVCEELIKIVEPSAVMPSVPKGGWNYADSYIGDGWSLAYRVFDAQYWGVPQRRRRIYLVADLRGERAREILFEREGLRGYFAEGRTPWQTAPADAQGSLGADDREGESNRGDGGRRLDAVGVINAIGGNAENCQETQTLPTLTCSSAPGFNNAVAVPYTLKIRSGCEGGGKGALIQEDKSATLATNSDQYLFQPVGLDAYNQALTGDKAKTLSSSATDADHVPCTVYSVENHPADSRVDIDDSGKVQTLTSRMGTGGGNVPMIMEPFCKSARGKFKGDAETWKDAKVANTLNTFDQGEARANELVVMATQQGGAEIRTDGKAPTLTAAAGMSGNNQPVICLQGNGIDRADTAGCNGRGWAEDTCYTLNTIDRPAVAYSFDSLASNSMKSSNPHSGCREVEVAKTLDTTDPNPSKNQGGLAIVQEMPVYAVDQGGGKSGANVSENTAPTLCTTHGGEPAVAYGLDRASFNQGKNAQFDFSVIEEQQPTITARGPGAVVHASKASFFTRASEGAADTLVATDYKDPQIVAYAESGTNGSRVSNTLVASMGNAPTGTTQDNLFVSYPSELHDFLADHNADAPHQQDQLQAADGIARPLVASTHGAGGHHTKTVIYDPPRYIVRRLTPTECARLQGFADWWGRIEPKDTFTEEELRFWLEVRNTHARINGKKEQDYTAKQMLTWYNKLWTDSAEYKMWGNGIALPTALYCVQGVADVLSTTQEEDDADDWMN